MRIDKFLKVSRLIKRRTIASEACTKGKILINGKVAKPSSSVNIGDIVQILFKHETVKVKILSLQDHAVKENAYAMYSVIES